MTESLGDDEAAYAYVRVKLGNDEYSERVKFAFVVWQGMLPWPFSHRHEFSSACPSLVGQMKMLRLTR